MSGVEHLPLATLMDNVWFYGGPDPYEVLVRRRAGWDRVAQITSGRNPLRVGCEKSLRAMGRQYAALRALLAAGVLRGGQSGWGIVVSAGALYCESLLRVGLRKGRPTALITADGYLQNAGVHLAAGLDGGEPAFALAGDYGLMMGGGTNYVQLYAGRSFDLSELSAFTGVFARFGGRHIGVTIDADLSDRSFYMGLNFRLPIPGVWPAVMASFGPSLTFEIDPAKQQLVDNAVRDLRQAAVLYHEASVCWSGAAMAWLGGVPSGDLLVRRITPD
jgi:hypothetical protein